MQYFGAFAEPAIELPQAIAWYTLCILIANSYMLICSLQCPAIAISNFFWLELSEILLVIGQFNQQPAGTGCIKAGAVIQIILAISCQFLTPFPGLYLALPIAAWPCFADQPGTLSPRGAEPPLSRVVQQCASRFRGMWFGGFCSCSNALLWNQ